ncbi:DUF1972 domain-containing protein [Pseudomonas sp. BT-42-2]|uniref:DUF1972 domain-containing protein n=1 Tax=Pseudomonas sp. BT-42-2 TaxID=2986927 RepID=UPI0021F7AB0A|nr:DUF1972 domain-containing protein [Pseudomonas sp. BT-42-2]MCV9919512.1 DUF1972 domain-containing protein [Pseudomonas sp. BT-42-2]
MSHLNILGIRGVPAMHGGFETFAERLSLYLVGRGWTVTVYCQENGIESDKSWTSEWRGIQRIHIPVKRTGALGTVVFDFLAARHALTQPGLFLTLGYNTAIFNVLQRAKGQVNLFNMDGIEWRREKWSLVAKAWFWLNERFGCWVGNHLIADHPEIKAHLQTRVSASKITMIPYGGENVIEADREIIASYGLIQNQYSIVIARPEPENSILEMVRAFSRKRRNHSLVILGAYDKSANQYHKKILDAASDEVLFLGAIYDSQVVQALRFYSRCYLHGHKVGGTNPSLVEALGAGCAVIAHDNKFNRWVAGDSAEYFQDEDGFSNSFDKILSDNALLEKMKLGSKSMFMDKFTWNDILGQYEKLLCKWL